MHFLFSNRVPDDDQQVGEDGEEDDGDERDGLDDVGGHGRRRRVHHEVAARRVVGGGVRQGGPKVQHGDLAVDLVAVHRDAPHAAQAAAAEATASIPGRGQRRGHGGRGGQGRGGRLLRGRDCPIILHQAGVVDVVIVAHIGPRHLIKMLTQLLSIASLISIPLTDCPTIPKHCTMTHSNFGLPSIPIG